MDLESIFPHITMSSPCSLKKKKKEKKMSSLCFVIATSQVYLGEDL